MKSLSAVELASVWDKVTSIKAVQLAKHSNVTPLSYEIVDCKQCTSLHGFSKLFYKTIKNISLCVCILYVSISTSIIN